MQQPGPTRMERLLAMAAAALQGFPALAANFPAVFAMVTEGGLYNRSRRTGQPVHPCQSSIALYHRIC